MDTGFFFFFSILYSFVSLEFVVPNINNNKINNLFRCIHIHMHVCVCVCMFIILSSFVDSVREPKFAVSVIDLYINKYTVDFVVDRNTHICMHDLRCAIVCMGPKYSYMNGSD